MACNSTEWLCDGHCIGRYESCKEECYYNKKITNKCNQVNDLQINIPAYCKDTQNCTITDDTCYLNSFEVSQQQSLCFISKDVCTNPQFEYRKCKDHERNIACQGHWYGQCILRRTWGDGVYDCLDRSDENIEKVVLATEPIIPILSLIHI